MKSPLSRLVISLSALVAAITLLTVSPTRCLSVSDELPENVDDSFMPYMGSAGAYLTARKQTQFAQ